MHPVSTKFKDYVFASDKRMLAKVEIGEVEYTGNDVIEFEIHSAVTDTEDFIIGATMASELIVKLRISNVVPPNARVIPHVAYTGGEGDSEWLPMGEYYVDRRSHERGIWTFTCLDKLMFGDVPFISMLSYPATMKAVWDEALDITGWTVDGDIVVSDTYTIPAGPGGFNVRQVMGYISACHGASLYADKDGVICWRQYSAAETAAIEIGPDVYQRAVETNPVRMFTRVVGIKDGERIEAGSGSEFETLTIKNPYLTQTIVDDLLGRLNGFAYQPIVITSYGIPQLDAGDRIVYGGDATTLAINITWRFKGGMGMQLDAPSKTEQQSEFGIDMSFGGQINRLADRAVLLGQKYYGISFSRERGLEQLREDGEGRAVWNADELSFDRSDGAGGWVSVLYFDAIKKTLVFDGILSANAIEAIKAEIDVVITNVTITNTLAAEKAYIAELTVDELETSDKVQKYLVGDTSDVNYIKIQGEEARWITASTDGNSSEQIEDRQGNKLYWLDNDKKGVTIEITEWPVMQYTYNETVKSRIFFEHDGGEYIPVIQLGAGVEAESNKGKAFLRKVTNGLHIDYYHQRNEALRSLKLTDDGIIQEGSVGGSGLRNIHIGPTPPANPQVNDLWIDTTGS